MSSTIPGSRAKTRTWTASEKQPELGASRRKSFIVVVEGSWGDCLPYPGHNQGPHWGIWKGEINLTGDLGSLWLTWISQKDTNPHQGDTGLRPGVWVLHQRKSPINRLVLVCKNPP